VATKEGSVWGVTMYAKGERRKFLSSQRNQKSSRVGRDLREGRGGYKGNWDSSGEAGRWSGEGRPKNSAIGRGKIQSFLASTEWIMGLRYRARLPGRARRFHQLLQDWRGKRGSREHLEILETRNQVVVERPARRTKAPRESSARIQGGNIHPRLELSSKKIQGQKG